MLRRECQHEKIELFVITAHGFLFFFFLSSMPIISCSVTADG